MREINVDGEQTKIVRELLDEIENMEALDGAMLERLPEPVRGLTRDQILSTDWDAFTYRFCGIYGLSGTLRPFKRPEWASVVRREAEPELIVESVHLGENPYRLRRQIKLTEHQQDTFLGPQKSPSSYQIPTWLPPRHARLRLHTMCPRSAEQGGMSVKAQQALKNHVVEALTKVEAGELYSLVIVGPAGVGKSALLYSLCLDLHTLRYRRDCLSKVDEVEETTLPFLQVSSDQDFCVFTLDTGRYLEACQEYATRDFGREVQRPLSADHILQCAKRNRLPPVLLLDEIDKFTSTPARVEHLRKLIDAVYEQNGCVLAAANMTLKQLEPHLGPAIWRRLSGRSEPDEERQKFMLLNLHPDEPRRKKAAPRAIR